MRGAVSRPALETGLRAWPCGVPEGTRPANGIGPQSGLNRRHQAARSRALASRTGKQSFRFSRAFQRRARVGATSTSRASLTHRRSGGARVPRVRSTEVAPTRDPPWRLRATRCRNSVPLRNLAAKVASPLTPARGGREVGRHAAEIRRRLPEVRFLSAKSEQVIVAPGVHPRHHPPSRFLTFSTVLSHLDLVALFHATSTHRISGLQSFSRSASRSAFRRPMLSCR
jgi:hypothetical protein